MQGLGSILGIAKHVPATVARKLLGKLNPKFNNYFSKAVSYGLDANSALDYLVDRFTNPTQKTHEQQLEQGEANKTLRPDEMQSKAQMRNQQLPGKIAKSIAGFGIGALLGGNQEGGEQPQPEAMQQQPMPTEEPSQQQAAPYDLATFQAEYPDFYGTLIERLQKKKDPNLALQVSAVKHGKAMKDVEKKAGRPFKEWFLEQIQGRSPKAGFQGGGQQSGMDQKIDQLLSIGQQVLGKYGR